MDFVGKRVMIAGEGVSGKGAFNALKKIGAACFYLSDGLIPADVIVVSPGIPPMHPVFGYARMNDIPVIGELELGAQLNTAPILAVTGTNGKTTTVSMLADILNRSRKTALVGNVGASFAQAASEGGYDVAVVEASSFQLETIETFRPRVAAILNITPDHLDRYRSMDDYAAAKMRIAENMGRKDLLILNADDIELRYLDRLHTSARVVYVGLGERVRGAYSMGDRLYLDDQYLCDRDRLKLQGEHNVKNALTAALAAHAVGAKDEDILASFGSFGGVGHRIEYVAHVGGKAYYNDSKGTNIAATLCACRAFDAPTCLILGGSDKGLDYLPLFTALPASVTHVLVTGETTNAMMSAAKKAGYKQIAPVENLTAAVTAAAKTPCDFVLLSPAAASFDAFTDYTARGKAFVEAVKHLEA